ncbi:protein trichome birefringence-like 6 [Magnolia sinica]|uniref:protein trichome birefringence-like 6 n=1 Tax=Magnolia sinica TaxID=86752 RepID=UPI00265AC702|nr:protein trichome birefringence-like 6 [Magnolia sinica]
MERQRSFSFKLKRLVVFSFTISSSLFLSFCFFFSSSVFKVPTPNSNNAFLQFNRSSFIDSLKSPKVHTFSAFTKNSTVWGAKDPTLEKTHLRESGNSSGKSSFHVFNEGKIAGEAKNPILLGDQFGKSDNSSEKSAFHLYNEGKKLGEAQNPVLVGTQIRKSANSTGRAIFHAFDDRKRRGEAQNTILIDTQIKKSDHSYKEVTASAMEKIRRKKRSRCDVYDGKWVFDESYPLYSNSSCPFIDEGFNCQSNGRLDREYMKWRWQPNDCDIPRFNASKMLELIRGKRVVFAGDSINRNQWESMLCLLGGAVADPKRVYETHGRRITKEKGMYSFRFVDYHCTVEYYVTHFLVHESKARVGHKRVQTLQIDTIDRTSSRWKGADILIFNTAHWWTHYKTKAGVNYYQERDEVHHHLDVSTAFRRALTTWASWIDQHVNPRKTRVFFRTSEPSHFRGGQWNSGGHCQEGTRPLNDTLSRNFPEKNIITEEVVKQMKTPVTILNITSLSEYRIDGHPSIYGRKPRKGTSTSIQDCSHWCLPGVPDAWNELLYFYLLSKPKTVSAE